MRYLYSRMSIVIWQRGFQVGQMEGVRSTAHRRRTRVCIQIKRGGRGSFCFCQEEGEFARNPGSSECCEFGGRSSINEIASDEGIKHASSAGRKKPRRSTHNVKLQAFSQVCQWTSGRTVLVAHRAANGPQHLEFDQVTSITNTTPYPKC